MRPFLSSNAQDFIEEPSVSIMAFNVANIPEQ